MKEKKSFKCNYSIKDTKYESEIEWLVLLLVLEINYTNHKNE